MSQNKNLRALKEKMIALRSGDYNVEAENPRLVKCWERLGCDKKDCPAYGKLRCWSIAGTFCRGEIQGEFAQKLGDCRKCDVYKESCGDEISEFIEVFNQMVKDFKFDISEKEKTEKEQARVDRTSELGNMIAAVAHETRNPLHSIGLAASHLKKNFHGELVSEFLNIIEEEVNKLNTLTGVFLSFSNPDPLTFVSCDINMIVREAVKDFCQTISPDQKSINLELAEDLPNIPCDEKRISEAVTRLLENCFESSENPKVSIITSKEKNGVRISVKDNGPGIPTEEQEDIFKPFYTTKINGPGLGLPIVERTAKEHNGSVNVESIPGKGSEFSVILSTDPSLQD